MQASVTAEKGKTVVANINSLSFRMLQIMLFYQKLDSFTGCKRQAEF